MQHPGTKKGHTALTLTSNLDIERRFKIINHCQTNVLLDIGANTGQYAKEMRVLGYRQKIVSFEPLKAAFAALENAAGNDDHWFANNFAIGEKDGKGIINISGNSRSSSIFNMLPAHLDSAPVSKFVGKEEIEIRKLDSVFHLFCDEEDSVMVKVDTQGYEKKVLEGATESLEKIKIVQLEMSLVPMYENETLFVDMINYLDDKGFTLVSLENGWAHPRSGRLLQVDGIFLRRSIANEIAESK